MRMTTMMTMRMRMRMRTKMTRWMGTRAIPPDNKQDDEPMTEIPVSDEVLNGDGDGDGEEASAEGGETGLEETKHKKTN
jgi:hypothetical protein